MTFSMYLGILDTKWSKETIGFTMIYSILSGSRKLIDFTVNDVCVIF